MRIVIQRCTEASVSIGGVVKGAIGAGMMILLGIEDADTDKDIDYLCRKIVALRIFDDADGVMNLPITEVADSGILLVSQFTLMASTKKGNRPSYIRASKPDVAIVYCTVGTRVWKAYRHRPIRCRHAGGISQRRASHHHH